MIFNHLQEFAFEPFFNISKYFLFVWSVINFLKCFYVAMSITSRRLPPFIVAAIITGITLFYFVRSPSFTWLSAFQILDLCLILYTVLTSRDGIFLLALLSLTIYFLKPFAFIVDVFVVLFMSIDLCTVFFENSPFWSLLYMNCLFVTVALVKMNSHGPTLTNFFLNALYVSFFGALSWNSTDRMRSIPACLTNVIYVLSQFSRDHLIGLGSPEFSQLPSNIQKVDLH